jgi:SWI/SNF-related matrix-associated actin-dependent regulator 1 of chromatin subfamily A
VDVIKLISKGTIEEDMYRLGQTKLALDEAVAGQNDDNDDGGKAEEQMKIGLLQVLRQKFEEEPAAQSTEAAVTTS